MSGQLEDELGPEGLLLRDVMRSRAFGAVSGGADKYYGRLVNPRVDLHAIEATSA